MIQNQFVKVGGRVWKIREARSMNDALSSITMAAVTGSVGDKSTLDDSACGGGVCVLADVVQMNADGTERQADTNLEPMTEIPV